MLGNTRRFSGTSAMPRATIACAGSAEISFSEKRIEPLLGLRIPAMLIIRVVLPAPLGPSKQVIEPAATSSDTPFSASILP